MIGHLSRAGASAMQHPGWRSHKWLQYLCALTQGKSVQPSYLSNAGISYEGTNTKFLSQMWSPQHVMCQVSVRSFHSCRNDHSITKGEMTDVGLKKKDAASKMLTGNVVSESDDACDTGATQKKTLTDVYLKRLAKLLKCSTDDMKLQVTKYPFLANISEHIISQKVIIMLKFGLPPSFVLNNPRLLYNRSADELRRRLQKMADNSFLLENSVVTLDSLPHYLECDSELFSRSFAKLLAEKEALEGCFDRLAYVQFRLKCSKETAQEFVSLYPLGRHMSNVKLKKVLDFFLNETQLSAQFVIAHRRLFDYSVERLRTRWRVCQDGTIKSEALMTYIFEMTDNEFDNMYGGSTGTT